jgi:hypothetical protein
MASIQGNTDLITSCKAITYRFVETKPEQASSSKKKKKR